MIALALTALGLALASPRAPTPGDGEGSAPIGGPAATASAPSSHDPSAATEGPRHLLALGWHGTGFTSKAGSQYGFQSAALGYAGSWNGRGPFLHVTALLPAQARQDGAVYTTSDYYDRRIGGDLLAGWQRRWALSPGLEGEAGAGVHAAILWLPGRTGYRDFSAMPVGLGAETGLRWRRGGAAFGRRVTLGTFASAAVDFWDPLRSNDLRRGLTVRLGLAVGVEGPR